LKLLGNINLGPIVLDGDQKRTLALLVSSLFYLKGTSKGIERFLRLVGLEIDLHEWMKVNREWAMGNPLFPNQIPNCSVIFELSINNSPLTNETKKAFADFVLSMFWICATIHEIWWKKPLNSEYWGVQDVPTRQIERIVCSAYDPYFHNFPDTVVIAGDHGPYVCGTIPTCGGGEVDATVCDDRLHIADHGFNFGSCQCVGNPEYLGSSKGLNIECEGDTPYCLFIMDPDSWYFVENPLFVGFYDWYCLVGSAKFITCCNLAPLEADIQKRDAYGQVHTTHRVLSR
jgi:hypothetical protein